MTETKAKIIDSEFFGSKVGAEKAARRWQSHGYATTVRYAMRADMTHDWLLEVTEG